MPILHRTNLQGTAQCMQQPTYCHGQQGMHAACQNCVSRLSLKTAAHKLVDSSSEYVWWIVPVNQLHARGWTDKRSTPRVMGWGRATQDANRNNLEPAHHCTLYASTALLPFGIQLVCTHAKMQRGCSQCKSPGAHYAHHHSNKQRSRCMLVSAVTSKDSPGDRPEDAPTFFLCFCVYTPRNTHSIAPQRPSAGRSSVPSVETHDKNTLHAAPASNLLHWSIICVPMVEQLSPNQGHDGCQSCTVQS